MASPQWLTIFEQGMGKHRSQRTGYLYKKGGYWYLQYRMDSKHIEPSGKPKRYKVTVQLAPLKGPGHLTEREARREAWAKYLAEVDKASIRPGSSITLEDFVRLRWTPDRLAHLSRKGRQCYETQLRNHIIPILGKKALRDIGLAQVQDLINQRAQWISPKTGRKLQVQSLARIVSTLKALFSHARRMDFITARPTDGLKLPKARQKEKRSLTWEQVETISAALPEPLSTLVLFLTWTGLRIGEACGLRWRDVDLEGLTIHVRENWVMGQYQSLKTPRSLRDIPIPKELASRLMTLRTSAGSDAPVFVNSTGLAPIDPHNVANRALKPLVKKLGLPWVSWHTFRHSNSTLAEQAGMTVSQRMMILGHTDPRTTRLYTHADFESARKMLGNISRLVH